MLLPLTTDPSTSLAIDHCRSCFYHFITLLYIYSYTVTKGFYALGVLRNMFMIRIATTAITKIIGFRKILK